MIGLTVGSIVAALQGENVTTRGRVLDRLYAEARAEERYHQTVTSDARELLAQARYRVRIAARGVKAAERAARDAASLTEALAEAITNSKALETEISAE